MKLCNPNSFSIIGLKSIKKATSLGGSLLCLSELCRRFFHFYLLSNSRRHYHLLSEGNIPRNFKENPIIFLRGLCLITFPEIIKNSDDLMGSKIGLYNVDNPISSIEVRNISAMKQVIKLLNDLKY